MQNDFAGMVGSTRAVTAGWILAGAARDEVSAELMGLTPTLDQSMAPHSIAMCLSNQGKDASDTGPSYLNWACINPSQGKDASDAGPSYGNWACISD